MNYEAIETAMNAMEGALGEAQSRIDAARIYAELRLGLEEKLRGTMDWYDERDTEKEGKEEE